MAQTKVRHLSGEQTYQAFMAMAANQVNYPDLAEELTEREKNIMQIMLNPAIKHDAVAKTLCISPKTLDTHITNISGKLGVPGLGVRVAQQRFLHFYPEFIKDFIQHYVYPISLPVLIPIAA